MKRFKASVLHESDINNQLNQRTTKILKLFLRNFTYSPLTAMSLDAPEAESSMTTKNPKTKFENDTPNEFSSGHTIRVFEIVLIFLILLLWLFSLRKFLKSFEKLRFTHYREITQKYRLYEPHNLNQVRVCRKQTDSVIYSRDPIKRLSLYPTTADEEKSALKIKMTKCKVINSNLKICEEDEVESGSLGSCSNSSVADPHSQRQAINENKIKKINSLEPLEKRSANFLDPNLVPSLVRSSLLDLHRRSAENLAFGTRSPNNTSSSNPNIKKETSIHLVEKPSVSSSKTDINEKKTKHSPVKFPQLSF